jgi:8-oxo-dGTP diphosphatase
MERQARYAANVVSSQPPTIRVVAAMVARDERYLITQRRATAILPLLWEFPGGRVEAGESDEAALVRELRERLDADVKVGQLISFVSHPYDHYRVELYLYECALTSDEVSGRNVADLRWVRSDEFEKYEFTPADEASMAKLLGVFS